MQTLRHPSLRFLRSIPRIAALLMAFGIAAGDAVAQDIRPNARVTADATDPTASRQVFVMTDSVMLGARQTFVSGLPGWQVNFAGRPMLTVRQALDEVRAQRALPPVAVMALGYNSLWEPGRRNFGRWANQFDASVEDMLDALKARGAHRIVWVLLRELTPDLVPGFEGSALQFHRYSWYFPYVNERLRAIAARHPEMVLADWATAARRNGLTYDAVHLNPRGAALMTDVVKDAMGIGRTATTVPPERRDATPARDGARADLPTASIPAATAAPRKASWVIQVGAFPEKGKALERLSAARSLGRNALAGANPFTEKLVKGKSELYRARFWGLDESTAVTACNLLRQNGMECMLVASTVQ